MSGENLERGYCDVSQADKKGSVGTVPTVSALKIKHASNVDQQEMLCKIWAKLEKLEKKIDSIFGDSVLVDGKFVKPNWSFVR